MNSVDLDLKLGTAVRSFLDKKFKGKNAPPKVPNAYNYNQTFSQEELEAVTDLQLLDFQNFSELSLFPNLKNLTISTSKNLELSEQDIETLKKITTLESLSINGYSGFKTIDCHDFSTKLYSLSLTNCPNLERVENLNANIDFFKCVGNYSIKNVQEIVSNTIHNRDFITDYVLDVSYAPAFFKRLKSLERRIRPESLELMKLNIRFGEEISRKIHIHNFNVINAIQKRTEEISSKIISQQDDELTKFSNLYLWVCKNVKYDFDGLEHSHRMASSNGLTQGEKMGTNNYLNGLLYGKCVCEGFSKTLQYLCAYNNIPTNLVLCHAGNEPSGNVFDHSILQYEEHRKARFCDITWDAMAYQKGQKDFRYFLLSKEEMSKDHKLITSTRPLASASEIDGATKTTLITKAENRFLSD